MSILQANGAGLGGAGDPGGALASSSIYGTTIDQSLRLDGSTAYLSKNDFGTATDTSKRTFSTWVKSSKDSFSSNNYIISASSSSIDAFGFNASEGLQWLQGGVNTYNGDRLLRDVGAWYHFFTTWNATDNEVYIYVNGELDKSFTSSISPLSKMCQSGQLTTIGKRSNSGTYIHGYLAETVFLDGTIGDINDFGELVNGIWVPKDISAASLTYGTNGFYLDYADSSDLGKDVSGKSNHFTSNSLAAEDQVPDSPTNNFATLNPLFNSVSQAVLSEGNLKAETAGFTSSAFGYGATSTFAIPKDKKIYIEVECTDVAGDSWFAGFATQTSIETGVAGNTGSDGSINVYNRSVKLNGTQIDYGASAGLGGLGVAKLAAGDILGCMCDGATGKVWFSRNGTYFKTPTTDDSGTTGDPDNDSHEIGTLTNGTTEDIFLVLGGGTNANNIFVNFGQDSVNVASAESDANGLGTFEYAPPTDYVCLAASSLSEPTIGPNSGDGEQADDYFNTVLYTGNATARSITGVGFQPDWTWIKRRDGVRNHVLYDSVRGATQRLISNTTGAEATSSTGLTSFDADGFSLGIGTTSNANTDTFVAWNWKAGGNADTFNIDGTGYATAADAGLNTGNITPTGASVNTTAGISIISFTGTGATSATPLTINHGLGKTPSMIILKDRDVNSNNNQWIVGHKGLATNGYIYLSATNASATSTSGTVAVSNADDTNFGLGVAASPAKNTVNESGDDFIVYLFADVDGFCKVGKYFTNNVSDGPFVYTGFVPKFVMIKRDGTVDWQILDTERATYNPNDKRLEPNTDKGEATTSSTSDFYADFLSNGFKLRGNGSAANGGTSATVLYIAYAEAPFKYANAR